MRDFQIFQLSLYCFVQNKVNTDFLKIAMRLQIISDHLRLTINCSKNLSKNYGNKSVEDNFDRFFSKS